MGVEEGQKTVMRKNMAPIFSLHKIFVCHHLSLNIKFQFQVFLEKWIFHTYAGGYASILMKKALRNVSDTDLAKNSIDQYKVNMSEAILKLFELERPNLLRLFE